LFFNITKAMIQELDTQLRAANKETQEKLRVEALLQEQVNNLLSQLSTEKQTSDSLKVRFLPVRCFLAIIFGDVASNFVTWCLTMLDFSYRERERRT